MYDASIDCSHRVVTREDDSNQFNTPVGEKRDPMWIPGCWRGQDDSSDTEEEDTNSTQSDVITKYNQAMACLSAAAGVENPPLLTFKLLTGRRHQRRRRMFALKELLKLVGLFAILLLQTMERTC